MANSIAQIGEVMLQLLECSPASGCGARECPTHHVSHTYCLFSTSCSTCRIAFDTVLSPSEVLQLLNA
eukprot:6029908-Amphidinium_carterae.1